MRDVPDLFPGQGGNGLIRDDWNSGIRPELPERQDAHNEQDHVVVAVGEGHHQEHRAKVAAGLLNPSPHRLLGLNWLTGLGSAMWWLWIVERWRVDLLLLSRL